MRKSPTPSHPPVRVAFWDGKSPIPEGVKVSWRPIFCAGFDVNEAGEREYHQFKYNTPYQCKCSPGPHYRAANSTAYEIGCGGGRGSGKSELGYGMSIRGNAEVPSDQKNPTDVSYINNPNFRGLILRKNSIDLQDWVSRAKQFYRMFGAVVTENPVRVRFPMRSELIASHLKDEDAFEKYQGQQFQFLWIEELNQIPDELTYEKVRMSIRSTIPGIKARVFVTFNPGGPGHTWTRNRFVYPIDHKNRLIPWGGKFIPKGSKITQTRIFYHSTVDDNPYFLQNEGAYIDNLDSIKNLSVAQYRRWRLGDFDAVEGQYFEVYRDKRIEGEPEQACHVTNAEAHPVKPWWPIHIAMDWGFKHNAALAKASVCPNGQFIVTDEIVASGIGSQDWGVRIAQWCIEDLKRLHNHTINLWLSPDAFGQRDDINTTAQQIQRGIDMVIGKGTAFILGDDPSDMFSGISFQQDKARIIIRRAQNQRIFGWQEVRGMMRWHSLKPEKVQEYSEEYANNLLMEHGTSRYLEYKAVFERRPEVLPKLLIYDNCKWIRQSIPMAVHDTEHEGREEDVLKTSTIYDDVLDMLRYLCMGYKYHVERIPVGEYVGEKLQEALRHDPTLSPALQFEVRRAAHEQFDSVWGKQPTAFSIGRGSRGMGGFHEARN